MAGVDERSRGKSSLILNNREFSIAALISLYIGRIKTQFD